MREKKKPQQDRIETKKDERFYDLRYAAYANPPVARWLIQHDPTIVSARNSLGETALHFLVVENQLEAVEFLAQLGCDVNTQNSFGASALLEAAQLGYVEMVALLHKLGAQDHIGRIEYKMEMYEVDAEKRQRIMDILYKPQS